MLGSLILLGMFIYIGIMVALLSLGSGSWLASLTTQQLCFKRPWPLRASTIMLSLLLFGMAVSGATLMSFNWLTLAWFVPVSLLSAGLMLFLSEPKKVWIDVDTRICHETKGWSFHSSKRTYSLSEASHLCVFRSGSGCYVVLWIGGLKDPMFMLAKAGTLRKALDAAQEMAIPLRLPVQEKTLGEMKALR